MKTIIRPTDYPSNGYMQGTCPKCKEWEAPITEKELDHMRDEFAHHGSSEKVVDHRALYRRLRWTEYFQCPNCKKRFGVNYSST